MISNNYDFSSTDYGIINEAGENWVNILLLLKITHKKFRKISWVGCLTVMYKEAFFQTFLFLIALKKE